jgi:hypothetical protein
MAHLACNRHDRRVMVLDKTTVHRSDGTPCDSRSLSINRRITNAQRVRESRVTGGVLVDCMTYEYRKANDGNN